MTDLTALTNTPPKQDPKPTATPQAQAQAQAQPTPAPTVKRIGGMAINSVSQLNPYINILIYGDPGVGKTILAGSSCGVEDMGPVLFVDVEGGTLSLSHTYPDAEVVRVQKWKDMQNIYDALYSGKQPYKTVVLDSLTELQKFSMAQIMSDLVKAKPDRDEDIASQQEWGKNIEQIRRLIRAFRDLPMHVIFTALAAKDKDPMGLTLTHPSLPGKLAGEVAGFVDIVGYYYLKFQNGSNKRYLLTSATAKEMAKDRSGKLPVTIEEPTMSKLHTAMFGN